MSRHKQAALAGYFTSARAIYTQLHEEQKDLAGSFLSPMFFKRDALVYWLVNGPPKSQQVDILRLIFCPN